MKKIILGLILTCALSPSFAQSTHEVKTYYDYYNTKIKAIELVIDGSIDLHGVQKYYYENGDLRDLLNFKLGKKHGVQKVFFHNGKIKVLSNYVEGQREGETKTYNYEGEKYYLQAIENFVNGEISSRTIFYPTGQKQSYIVVN